MQLKEIRKIIDAREKNFKIFQDILRRKNEIVKIKVDHIEKLSSFAIPMVFKNIKLKKKFVKIFQKSGIEIRPLIAGNIEKQPFFKNTLKVNLT